MILPMDSKLEPVVDADTLHRIDKDAAWQKDEIIHCAEEPWYWAVNYIYTIRKDEFSIGAKPEIRRFPPMEHLRFTFHRCFTDPFLTVDKSRQLTLTWLFMLYELHIAQFGRHEDIIVQTKKEVDADLNLVKRAEFMAKGQRFWMRPRIKSSYCNLKFPDNDSSIRGLPGGSGAGDQIRSANPSRYFLDEGGFVDEFEDCRTAALACCADIKIVSTANAGEFERFIEDKMEAA